MEPKRTGESGDERLARGVASAINARTDRYLKSRPAPLSYGPVALRFEKQKDRRRIGNIALATVGCAAVAGVLGFWVRSKGETHSQETLTYLVDGAPAALGGLVASSAANEPVVSFSDGTRIRLAARARSRVVNVGRRGARVALDEGKADVEVAHLPGAEWFFEAGPFLVTVHGTAFSLEWNAKDARFGLKMRSGVVSVSGPVAGGEVVLRAGQSLSLSLNQPGGSSANGPAGPDVELAPPVAPAIAPATPSAIAPASASAGRLARPADRLSGPADWSARLADGQAAGIVAEARRRGLSKVLELSSSEDLAALADAARFERQTGLARRALLSQRRRFPGSPRAVEASFLLGRLDDSADEGSAPALGWYDRYLNEAPGGAYVSEALGRKMMVLERSGNRPAATRIARDYLQRFPGGTYSRAAQALVRQP